jgi:hypothetical protein
MTVKPLAPVPPELLRGKKNPDLVTVPERHALAIRGEGPPDSLAFAEAVGALYGVAYTLRADLKRQGRAVFKVGPMDGEWWAEGEGLPESGVPDRHTWRWDLRITVPPDTASAAVADAVRVATTKKNAKLEPGGAASRIELRCLASAQFARILHVGPYADEPRSFGEIERFLADAGLERARGHVEVYVSDPGRTAPEKLKTVLLVPIR